MKNKRNLVFVARSLDGYIAGKNGELDWLNMIPNPEQLDMGYTQFIEQIDAIVMGRNTFEMVASFDVPWPYKIPVFVLSHTLTAVPTDYLGKIHLVRGSAQEVLKEIHEQGYHQLYIDGGTSLQGFLREDLIDEMIITTIPILLGEGIPLFSPLSKTLEFELVGSETYLDQIVQNHYRRKQ